MLRPGEDRAGQKQKEEPGPCTGPRLCLVCLRINEEASVAEAE